MSKEGYDAEYKASRIQTSQTITKIKQKRLKELEDTAEKLTGQITQ